MPSISEQQEGVLADLLNEETLWQVYKRSRKIPHSRLNGWVGCIALTTSVLWSLYAQRGTDVADNIQTFAALAFNTSVSLLGFLLAGFSFFATVHDKSMFCRMAELKHPKSGLTFLKHNLLTFMRVFCQFLALAMISLVVSELFAQSSGARNWVSQHCSWFFGEEIKGVGITVGHAFASAIYGAFFGCMAYLLMQLSSFIFNVYHVTMTSVKFALIEEYSGNNPEA